jgi:ABC-type polysaccharide/polyol phosphate transport system ATPase subunit
MDAVRFEEISKQFRKGGAGYKSIGAELRGLPKRALSRLSGRAAPTTGTLALDHVTFSVREGESFALIGPNGAGKSTALRIVSGITEPTGGRMVVRGRVGALIEVGSGVHFELTGRENIWLYGSILGLSRADIRSRFDTIVEFSELGDAIDTQVKYYSTGMQLRLGFSVASHLEPDVFVVDEALAVGDVNFQAKCVERMTSLVRQGTTLIFVSHHLPAIESLCERGVMLDRGQVVTEGPAKEVLARYIGEMESRRLDLLSMDRNHGRVRIVSVTCHDADGNEVTRVAPDDAMEIRLRFESDEPLERPHVVVGITDGRPGVLIECSMLDDDSAPAKVGREFEVSCVIERLPLRPRLYEIWCDVIAGDGYGRLSDWIQVGGFRVVAPVGTGKKAVVNAASAGALAVGYHWEVRT